MSIQRMTRRQLAGIAMSGSLAAIATSGRPVAARQATPVPDQMATPVPTGTAWPLYGHDLSGRRATTDSAISSMTVGSLAPRWEVPVDGPVSATPVIASGAAFVGSYDGKLYAIDVVSGATRWVYDTGAAVPEPNLQIPLGILGSAAVDGDTVFVGDATATVHSIDRVSGEPHWTTRVDDQQHACIWSSPVVSGGRVFVGVASIAKEVGFRGSVVALDADTGSVQWQAFMVPETADGAGVFAVPAIDEGRGILMVGTQNAYSPNPAPYGNPISMVALDVATGEQVWVFNAPPGGGDQAPTDDVAFSASPNLFSATVDGQPRDLVGEGQKSGDYWVLDRDTGEVVWNATVSPSGFLGGMEGTSAVSNGVIVVPATDWPEFDGPAAGLVTALDAVTGEQRWSASQDAPAASPASIVNDLVLHAGIDGVLHAYALGDGSELWRLDLQASVSGGIAIAGDTVVLGAATPQFAPFVRPGTTIRAFGIGEDLATPVSTVERLMS